MHIHGLDILIVLVLDLMGAYWEFFINCFYTMTVVGLVCISYYD